MSEQNVIASSVSLTNKEKIAKYMREYNEINKERLKAARDAKHAANPEKRIEANRKWAANNKEKKEQYCKEWKIANPDRAKSMARKAHLKYHYNITPEEFDSMLSAQNNSCGICYRQFGGKVKLHVDHCHETNKVRALLCHRCNTAIGSFQESSELLRSAAAYLETHGK